MSKQQSHRLIAALVTALAVLSGQVRAVDLGTAFTYQGFLEKGGPPGPVTDTCDFRFGLWKDASSTLPADQAGPTLTFDGFNAVSVDKGVFTVALDFGAGSIDGTARWLNIEVCCSSPCALEPLTPRVELTPAPYALAVPGLRIDQTSGSPNVLGGFSGNSATAGVEGATIAGGGAAFESTDGRCSGDPQILCALNADCGGAAPCVPNASVGRCDDDATLCDSTHACLTGLCIPPPAPNQALANYVSIGGGSGNIAGGVLSLGGVATGAKGVWSVVGGGFNNTASGAFSTVAGGIENKALGEASSVGGGALNMASGRDSTIGGGWQNTASAESSTVAGGLSNTVTVGAFHAAIGGGAGNTVGAQRATVGGGENNTANGSQSTVPGGLFNTASGYVSLAAGQRAKALDNGTFVWADSTAADFVSSGGNQFLIRASGGVGIGTNSPASALDVNGTSTMTGFKLTTSPGSGLVLTSDASGNGTWQAAGGGSAGWELTGNALTTPGTNFLGTTDNQALQLHVNGARVLRLEPEVNATVMLVTAPNILGGWDGNTITPGVAGATIGGGGGDDAGMGIVIPNSVTDDFGTIGGGALNQAGDNAGTTGDRPFNTVGGGISNYAYGSYSTIGGGASNGSNQSYSTVGGGHSNGAGGSYSTVGGGTSNQAIGSSSTVSGGESNGATGTNSTVGGGYVNYARGSYSTVPGGERNWAGGDYSFAAGLQAHVRDGEPLSSYYSGDANGDEGAFVWADSTAADFVSSGANQFLIRASGGVGIGTNAPEVALHVEGGTDVNAASGGYSQMGRTTGSNLALDDNEIQARNNGAAAILKLNAEGGNVRIHSNVPGTQVEIENNGNVGIGRTPTANKLEVEGDASKTTAGGWAANSDARIKTDVMSIDGALQTIERLRPIRFKYTDEYKGKHDSIKDIYYYNYVAQEFREVFPNHVKDSGEDGILQLDAYPASVYAVAAIQELHALVQDKDCQITELQEREGAKDQRINELEARVAALEATMSKLLASHNGGGR